ncbi:MAG: hypothetical protein QHJ73_12230, partial [Armatimonadota bacterium]|nr:hypothetical protein [Armatimonadota bacterium]
MRNLRRSRWHREIARLLTVLMLLPPMLLSVPGRPAEGQTKVKTVAVMDFENPTGRQGLALGRKAADALALALDNYDVVPREQVEKQLATLGLTPPLDRTSLIKLGRFMEEGLGLTEIFTGRVLRAEVTKRTPKQALVRVEVRVLDVESEEFTNGTVAEGVSTPRYDDVGSDVLIDDAVQKAAFAAVRRLASQLIPQGAVLGNSRGEIIINRGSRDGIRPGMELIVLRGKEKVARIVTVTVTDRDSVCAVREQTRGVMVEDIVRPVYTSTVGTGTGTLTDLSGRRVARSLNWSSIAGIAGGIVLGLVTIKLIKTKAHVNQGPVDIRAAAALDGNGQPAVRISWKKPSTPAAPDLLGFKIYRSRTQYGNYDIVEEVPGPFEQVYYDTTDTRQ